MLAELEALPVIRKAVRRLYNYSIDTFGVIGIDR